ncbi:lysylphosphatidylglycerol synthase transmembrane domain-containing protein [Niveibacterium sp. COAC-50]|uniref:lysylphosphatidylglycerol synthase transmembrane domain-containing protein n=1 Tax=Niveibacterium sp. COAC-50 TaxID=2729384 RepID=UPI001C131312|nr:lysylphosphatidylglycerol synthase transmembrane domain-containing protein [Niveibacterium sp. COAC-50]
MAITLSCLVYVFGKINVVDLRVALVRFYWPHLLVGVLSLTFGYAMRIVRWSNMLRAAGARVSARQCAAPFLASIAMNNVLPFRVGDVVRAFVFPQALCVSRASATGSLVMERLVDLLALLIALGLGVVGFGRNGLPAWLRDGALALAVMSTLSLVILFLLSAPLSRWLFRYIETRAVPAMYSVVVRGAGELLSSFAGMSKPKALLALFGLSALVWIGELGLFFAVLTGFNPAATMSIAGVVMAVATLSTLVPSSPGYVGPFHVAAYFAIGVLGGDTVQAVSCAVVMHLALWLPTTLAGGVAILLSPNLFRAARRSRDEV